MKALKITFITLLVVAAVFCLTPVVYGLVANLGGEGSPSIGEVIKLYFSQYKDIGAVLDSATILGAIAFLLPILGLLLLILWVIFGCVKKRFLGILYGFIAVVITIVASFGYFVSGGEETINSIMQYVALASAVVLLGAFVVNVVMMFKHKPAKTKKEEIREEVFVSYGLDPNDLPPVLFEEEKKDHQPDIVVYHDDHIPVTENHILKKYYLRDDEVEAILATGAYSKEEEIPESILAFLNSKHEAEEQGVKLAMFDPNFVPTEVDKAMLTDEELFVLEALKNYRRKEAGIDPEVSELLKKETPRVLVEEEVPERIKAFLNDKPVEEEVEHLPIFDPNFVPEHEPKVEPISTEDLAIVEAMRNLEVPEKGPEYFGVSDEDYVDLPIFEGRGRPVEIFEEVIGIEEPSPRVDAPKLANTKPVHISRNKEGKYQLKQVGEDKPLAVFDTEEEAVEYGKALKEVNGVAVRIHDEEGKISSL